MDELKREVHRFSGLNPEEFTAFMASAETFEQLVGKGVDVYVVAGHLYQAIEHAARITSDAPAAHHAEEMNEICRKLGIYGEFLIQQSISGKNVAFRSRYLKDLV